MSYVNLNWDYYKIRDDGKIVLVGAYLNGPGLGDSYKLLPNDSIDLDFTKYYSGKELVDAFYIINFAWSGARHGDSYTVYFKQALLSNVNFDLFARIKRKGYIEISLQGHQDVEHYKNFFYTAEVKEY